ncbi:MAG: ABC transporter ATP-binding protein [Defluviitaleaceae bacterium]|nr:ABC transporter ATP-binding protein [Defluviitaleaceae bacterium]
MKEILRFNNVSLRYQADNGEVEALKDICLCVEEGELVSVVGPSGCGKTTLLSLAAGLESPTSGEVLICGDKVRGVSGKMGYMLQKDSLLDWRTIRGNVLIGLEIRGARNKENIEYADSLLKNYGLWEFREKHPSQLSGGMRQRAALIRTLAVKPEILLLDEAFSALDYQTRLVVADDVFNILRREKKTAIIVTHDIAECIGMADRIIVISKRPGRVSMDFPVKFTNGCADEMPPLKRRDDPSFREYFNLIRKELGIDG